MHVFVKPAPAAVEEAQPGEESPGADRLRRASETVIEGMGPPDERRPKPIEVVATEAFIEAAAQSPPKDKQPPPQPFDLRRI